MQAKTTHFRYVQFLKAIIFFCLFATQPDFGFAQNVGIGTNSPQAPLHVVGTILTTHLNASQSGRFDQRIAINAAPNNSYRLFLNGGHTFLGGNLTVENDGIIENNFRINGRIGINGATNGAYGLYVNNSNSYFQGNIIATGTANITGSVTTSGNLNAGNNLNVTNDGIIENNFRVNGRVGINGGTHGSYGLIVNNSNSYFQGNVITTGTVSAVGNLTIKGNGHVRSNGSSNLKVGFTSKYVNVLINNGDAVSVTANIADFSGNTDDARVFVAQVVNDGGTLPWSKVNITVMGVNSTEGTCILWLHNESGSNNILKGTIYLTTIAKD
jgi:hypothetical protein